MILFFFFFNDTATTEIYTLSLHDALPILLTTGPNVPSPTPSWTVAADARTSRSRCPSRFTSASATAIGDRSEEHTSELQSRRDLVCRLLLEKKKKKKKK